MKTRGDQLPNCITPQSITPSVKPEWRRSANCKFSLSSPLGLLTHNRPLDCHRQNRDSSVITKDDLVIQCSLSVHHLSLATRCSRFKGSRTIGRYNAKPCERILRQIVRIDTCLSKTALQVASTDGVVSNGLTEASRRRCLSLSSFVIRGRPLPFLRLSEASLDQALHDC
jgi:hypothetical protein